MATSSHWYFEPFRLDLTNACLWRDETLVALRPKPFAVLAYLVTHAGQTITKDILLEAVWPETVVGDAVLKDCIRQVRRALGETAQAPQYVATVHRRGYRFMATVTAIEPTPAVRHTPPPVPWCTEPAFHAPQMVASSSSASAVAREAELAHLHQWWAAACQGERRIGWIAGEAGIGKTTLVETFAAQVATPETVWLGHGQCIEHYGAGEPYLPLLDAFGRLGRSPRGASLVELMWQYAPSWLAQLPTLVSAHDMATLQQRGYGATRERMLRELAEVVELLSGTDPLILVLEDLHWSDTSTLEWLAYVARRRERARLLVLGTYRPVEAIMREHPLRSVVRELQRHDQCDTLRLGGLSASGVATYLDRRFAGQPLPNRLAATLHQRTSGHPLFLISLLDDMVQRGMLREGPGGWEVAERVETAVTGVPESLRLMIEQQLERLAPEDRWLLEAASVVGVDFTAAAVASGLDDTATEIEERTATLARREQFVQTHGIAEWPDGTVTTRYRFLHALYQEVLYDQIPVGRRIQWHQRIGARLVRGYGEQAREMAAELTVHFLRGRDAGQAVPYLQYAGENALRRSAHQEAITHFQTGLEILATLPTTAARVQRELVIQLALGGALLVTKGYASPEVEEAYTRAQTLCQQVDDPPQLFPMLWGLLQFYLVRAEFETASALGEQLLSLAQRVPDPPRLGDALNGLGTVLVYRGELGRAQAYLEESRCLASVQTHDTHTLFYGIDLELDSCAHQAHVLWLRGYADQARQASEEAVTRARHLAHPFSLAHALGLAAMLRQFCREVSAVAEQAETAMALALEQGFPHEATRGMILRGWAWARQGRGEAGVADVCQGLAAYHATGVRLLRPYYLALLAELLGALGQLEAGLRLLNEALEIVDKTGEHMYEAELYRLKGTMLLQPALLNELQAETYLHHARDVARDQQAKAWELRVAISLGRLWQRQGQRDEAHRLLADISGWFTEGFDTADFRMAKRLLAELGV